MIATAQFTISVVSDGVGISSTIIEYAVSASGITPPGNPITDGSGNPIMSNDGKVLTDGSWSTILPTVPQGQYLWTRTRMILSDGTFDMVYNVSYSGENGMQGEQGVSIVNSVREYRLSDSSTTITGSGDGYAWSETSPQVGPSQYLWKRIRNDLSNNTSVYSEAHCDITITNILLDVDRNAKAITQKVSQTDIDSSISSYDSSTAQTIRDNVSSLTTDLGGITTRVGQAESTLATKADGSTVTTLSNDYSAFKQTMNGFKTTVESNYATLENLNSLKVSGDNLYWIKDSVSGYIHATNGTISSASDNYHERSSDYISVLPNETYIIQAWATPTNSGISWLAYQFYSSQNSEAHIGERTAKYGSDTDSGMDITADGKEHLMYKVVAPENAHYLRVSYRQFDDGCCMVEKATLPSEYAIAPVDIEFNANSEISSVRTIAEQNADHFSWLVEDGSTSSQVTYTANALTAMANQIDLTGKVTFNSMNSALQNRITGVETSADTALKGLKAYTGTSSTAAGTAAKVVTCSDTDFALTNGTTITITFSTASTADAPTLNVNSKGAKAIYFDNAVTSSSNRFRWQAGSTITFQYNGTYWVVLNYENLEYFTSSTTASTAAKVNATATGTFVLCKGTTINVYFSTANSANAPTLNIGGTGAYAIYYKNAVTSSSNQYLWDAGTALTFTYNGSYWHVNDGGSQLVKNYAKPAVNWVSSNGTTTVTATDIMKQWVDDATLATTTIDGGYIKAHTIETEQLATNAIMSSNYSSGSDTDVPSSASHYTSNTGSFFDLATGDLYTPKFSLTDAGAYLNGEIIATSGRIGEEGQSYWQIGTTNDSTWTDKAALIAHGNSLIQTGKFTLSNDRLNSFNGGDYIHVLDSNNQNWWYDFGIQVPDKEATGSIDGYGTGNTVGHKKNFLYIRRINTQPDVNTLDSAWSYLFRVDDQGDIYWNGHNISEGTYLPLSGGELTGALTVPTLTVTGTLTGTASAATQLANPRTIQTNLESTSSASFNGTANVTPGVTGTLGVGNGGTGQSSWTANRLIYSSSSAELSELGAGTSGQVLKSNGTSAPTWVNQSTLSVGEATSATQDSDGNAINTTYRKLSNNTFDTIDVTDATVGNLVVSGGATFTNGLSGNLTGNVTGDVSGSAGSVANNLKIQLNGGTTEGTSQFTYDGSAAKNINITKSSIGLANVENTALSTWSGSANLTTTSVGTLAGAATKGVDTSIDDESTSSNLPTSAAVASFVEGKGYVTSSGVTSARVQATSPVVSSQNTAQDTTLNTTISLANGYGDTKNPYGTKTANYVLAGPSSGSAAVPTFRKLVAADIPTITTSKISDFPTTWALANVSGADDLKAIEDLDGTSGILKKTAANTWGLTTVVQGISINNDKITVTKSDSTTEDLTINITGQVVSGATILSDSQGNPISLGSASAPVYFSNGVPAQANAIPTISLNGSATTSPSFYAPTGAGTSGQYLKSNGSGAPTWATFSKSTVGLGNVDNTADTDKPISTATQAALDDKANKNNGIYVVKGTQTAATPDWTGNIAVDALYDGLTIAYYLPYAGTSTAATLNLTLADGTTTTGEIPVYYTGNTRATTHCAAGSTVILTYWSAGSISVSGNPTETGSWRRSDYTVTNSNTYDRRFMNDTRVYAGANGIKTYSLIMQDSTGKWQSLTTTAGNNVTHTKNPSGFRPDTILRYAYSNNIAANALTSNDYIYETGEMDFRYSSNCESTLTARKSVYIVGTMDDGYFYLADDWYSQDLPTTEDGKVYIYIGEAFSGYQVTYTATHPMYMFKNGRIIRYSDITKTDLGLSNVDNTADADKSVSYANTAGSATSATTATNVAGASASTNSNRHVWFSHSDTETKRAYDNNFMYNPSTNTLTVANITGNASSATTADSATQATEDGDGNTITSYYVTLSTAQTVTGAKTFSAATSFTNTTASTSKSTGAVKVSGGMGVAGRVSANENMIGDHVVLSYNATTSSLDFIFT